VKSEFNFKLTQRSPHGHKHPYFGEAGNMSAAHLTVRHHKEFGGDVWMLCELGVLQYQQPENEGPDFFIKLHESREKLPATGYNVKHWRCDQTGGMCMVDVYILENNLCITVTDECLIVHEDARSWEMEEYEGREPLIEVDFC